jgi:hypothetical protein
LEELKETTKKPVRIADIPAKNLPNIVFIFVLQIAQL